MDLTQIRYFLALARTLNFTRAAEACNVTQPALTKSIQRLEEELGGPLLLRERALTQLTTLGTQMLPMLERIQAAATQAREHAARFRSQPTSPLRLGLVPGAPLPPFSPVLAELSARLPCFTLSVAEAPAAALAEALLNGTVDVAIVTGDAAVHERMNRWPLFQDRLVLLVPEGHALDDGEPIAAELAEDVIDDATAPEDGSSPPRRHRVSTSAIAADLVRAGLGTAWSTELAAPFVGLRRRPVAGHGQHDVALIAMAGRPLPTAVDAFLKLSRARGWRSSHAGDRR